MTWARRRLTRPGSWRIVVAGVLLAWVVTSAALAIDRTQGWRWTASRASIDAFMWLYHQPELCGLAIDDIGLYGATLRSIGRSRSRVGASWGLLRCRRLTRKSARQNLDIEPYVFHNPVHVSLNPQ